MPPRGEASKAGEGTIQRERNAEGATLYLGDAGTIQNRSSACMWKEDYTMGEAKRRKERLAKSAADSLLSRTPSQQVRRQLRRESGFVCAYPGCQEPYLQYHHFDPEWHVEQHHRPEGMIALCPNHHSGAAQYTVEDLRAWKARGPESETVRHGFEWRRERTVFIAGGNLSFGCREIVTADGSPLIWLTEDERGWAMLNLDIRDASGSEMFKMLDSDWVAYPGWDDIELATERRSLSLMSKLAGISLKLLFSEVSSLSEVFELAGMEVDENRRARAGLGPTSGRILVCRLEGRLIWPIPVRFSAKSLEVGSVTLSQCQFIGLTDRPALSYSSTGTITIG